MKEVAFRRISTGSIFKIVFFGSWIGSLPVFLLFGILATFGVEIISWNEKYIIGPIALVGGPLLGLFFATILGAILGSLGACPILSSWSHEGSL